MGMLPSFGLDGEVVAILLDVGKSHACSIPQFPDLLAGGRPAFGHGEVEIGYSWTGIDDLDGNGLFLKVTDNSSPVRVGDYIDLRLKDGNHDALDRQWVDVQLFEQSFQIT